MSFRESFYQTKQLLVNRLNDFGILSANMNMGWTTLLTIEQNTRITIDVPLNLIYTDEFLITGTLETSTYSRLNGKTLKLKVGNTVVDTTTTNVNGEYSFTHTPVSTGTHSFQVIFEGTNVHAASESSVVTREVGKETSVMNLDAQSTKHYGDNVILGGTLLTDDGEYIKNASVKYYVDNSLISTLTTDNYGVFTAPTRTIDGFDNLNIQFVYEGDSNYTSVSANQTVDVYQLDLRLTSDKNILSYADNESVTITAQLIDNAPTPQNLAIENTEIIFEHSLAPTTYSDFSSIPVQYDSFELLFKSQGTTFYIYGSDEYPLRQITVPTNSSSQFKLVWDKTKLSLYQDNAILSNSITDYFGREAVASYTDNHVRFATLNNNTVDLTDIKIRNMSSSSNIYTDANGQARYTYGSQGIGDVEINAKISGSLVSEIFSIVDSRFADDQSSDKTSSYVVKRGTISKTLVQNQYIEITGGVNEWNSISPITLSTSDNWSFEVDMMQTNRSNRIFIGLSLVSASNSSNSISNLLYTSEYASYGYGSPNSYLFRDSSLTGTINKWYHFKWQLIDGVLHYYIYDENNTELTHKTINLPSVYSNVNVYPCIERYENTQTGRFRNVVIKPL